MGKQVQLLTTAATATWRGGPGDIVELPDAEALQLIVGGYAIEPPAPEGAAELEALPAEAEKLPPGDDTEKVAGPAVAAAAPKPRVRPVARKKAKPHSRRGASKAPSGE